MTREIVCKSESFPKRKILFKLNYKLAPFNQKIINCTWEGIIANFKEEFRDTVSYFIFFLI